MAAARDELFDATVFMVKGYIGRRLVRYPILAADVDGPDAGH